MYEINSLKQDLLTTTMMYSKGKKKQDVTLNEVESNSRAHSKAAKENENDYRSFMFCIFYKFIVKYYTYRVHDKNGLYTEGCVNNPSKGA
ncbi:hypothetical protein NC653_040099 [Populus alba x Populus x berolinensis]|uniref:Uncharacterized protein n=1 Tax=Populus alba x Populus x berolinensis TaxID=444605 RepID=A0AAD6PS69_9ROSI|nr:hypothetical protein NC653_040099 [Populus alba x Populus x berolinensis]